LAKIKAAIIGSGNIGTDLMVKMVKYPQNMELVAVVGIDQASEGLAMARERGVATTHEGIEGFRKMSVYPDVGIVFDATSAYAHKAHDAVLRADGKQVASSAHQDRFVGIDTPKHAAAIGNLLDRKSIPEIWLCRFFRHESS